MTTVFTYPNHHSLEQVFLDRPNIAKAVNGVGEITLTWLEWFSHLLIRCLLFERLGCFFANAEVHGISWLLCMALVCTRIVISGRFHRCCSMLLLVMVHHWLVVIVVDDRWEAMAQVRLPLRVIVRMVVGQVWRVQDGMLVEMHRLNVMLVIIMVINLGMGAANI